MPAATWHRAFSKVGGEGSDADFAPKTKAPEPSANRNVQDEIKHMVTTRKVVLFMKGTPDFPMCGFSNRAVQILDHHKTKYGAFNVLEDQDVREVRVCVVCFFFVRVNVRESRRV